MIIRYNRVAATQRGQQTNLQLSRPHKEITCDVLGHSTYHSEEVSLAQRILIHVQLERDLIHDRLHAVHTLRTVHTTNKHIVNAKISGEQEAVSIEHKVHVLAW